MPTPPLLFKKNNRNLVEDGALLSNAMNKVWCVLWGFREGRTLNGKIEKGLFRKMMPFF